MQGSLPIPGFGVHVGPGFQQHLDDSSIKKRRKYSPDSADPDTSFWADYTGAVTAAVATLIRTWPKTQHAIKDNIRYALIPMCSVKVLI